MSADDQQRLADLLESIDSGNYKVNAMIEHMRKAMVILIKQTLENAKEADRYEEI